MNQMNLADLQMLAALTNAAHAAEQAQAQQQQQAAAAFASLSAQQSSHYSRQSTPPMSSTNSPKVSTNNTRTPTPTQNGIPQVHKNMHIKYICILPMQGGSGSIQLHTWVLRRIRPGQA